MAALQREEAEQATLRATKLAALEEPFWRNWIGKNGQFIPGGTLEGVGVCQSLWIRPDDLLSMGTF